MGGGYKYSISIIPNGTLFKLYLNSSSYSYFRPRAPYNTYYYCWAFSFENKDFSQISGGYKTSHYYTTNQPAYLRQFITDVSNTSYANTKIAFANYDIYSEDSTLIYFYGTFLRYKTVSLPFLTSLKSYMKNGFQSTDTIEVVINDFPNLKGDGTTVNNMTFSVTNTSTGEELYSTTFNRGSPFYSYVESAEDMPFYKIPVEDFYSKLSFGTEYSFLLSYEFEGQIEESEQVLTYGYDYSQEDSGDGDSTDNNATVIGGMTNSIIESNDKLSNTIIDSNNKLQNSIDGQTDAIKENTETNKNIFERIGEILSYINPFSENFFGKKLVELIIEALKSLFVPDEEFLKNFLNDFDVFLNEHFGLLYQPFSMITDLLNRFLNINLKEPSINIPDIKEPFTGGILLPAFEFKFNTILETDVFNYIYQIYLLAVDAMLVFIVIKQIGKIEERCLENDYRITFIFNKKYSFFYFFAFKTSISTRRNDYFC